MIDGGLRGIFRKKIPSFMWVSVETGMTGRGIPDSHYCRLGVSGWVEWKVTNAWSVGLRPEQVAWILRYHRNGGRVWVAVRRQVLSGPRRGPAADELWLIHGWAAADLKSQGLKKIAENAVAGVWPDGPTQWDWAEIERLLLS